MPQPTIVYAPTFGSDVSAIAHDLLPAGFDFRVVDSGEVPTAVLDADYLMGFIGKLSDETFQQAKRLKLVQLMSVGYDKFNLEGARAARVPVAVNGGANAIAVAEHAIMLMLSALRHLTEIDASMRAGEWRGGPALGVRLYEIWSSTVGIVGMGRIGQEVARRLQNWEAKLVYFDPYRP